MKLFYIVTEDWFFYIHRLPTLRAAIRLGFDVILVTHIQVHKEKIEEQGIRVVDFPFDRKSKNPLKAVMTVMRLYSLYRKEKPDIVHHIALKPVLFGSLAAVFARVPNIVNGYVGLGSLFYPDSLLIWTHL